MESCSNISQRTPAKDHSLLKLGYVMRAYPSSIPLLVVQKLHCRWITIRFTSSVLPAILSADGLQYSLQSVGYRFPCGDFVPCFGLPSIVPCTQKTKENHKWWVWMVIQFPAVSRQWERSPTKMTGVKNKSNVIKCKSDFDIFLYVK